MATQKQFRYVEPGEVVRFPTGCILARVSRLKVLVCEPCFEFEDERGKIVDLVEDDLNEFCSVLDLTRRFYK